MRLRYGAPRRQPLLSSAVLEGKDVTSWKYGLNSYAMKFGEIGYDPTDIDLAARLMIVANNITPDHLNDAPGLVDKTIEQYKGL